MSQQSLNIIILGASFAGLAVTHNFLDNIIHQLSTFEGAPSYRVILVSPSTHLYWNMCAPRTLVSPYQIPTEKAFLPIEPPFARHPFNEFKIIQGFATAVNTRSRNVTVELVSDESKQTLGAGEPSSPQSPNVTGNTEYNSTAANRGSKIQCIPYHALVLATGTSAHSPLYKLNGTHEETMAEIQAFHEKVEAANSIIIVGGGPSGCETAGQLSLYFNHGKRSRAAKNSDATTSVNIRSEPDRRSRLSFFSHRKHEPTSTNSTLVPPTTPVPPITTIAPQTQGSHLRKPITLLSGSKRLLPNLKASIGHKAEEQLKKLGVHIVHNIRQVGATLNPDGSTNCILNNDMTIKTCVCIQATGVYPNTQYLPARMLDEQGYVITDSQTLRVYGVDIGDRVYAIGDCASYSRNSLQDIYDAVPVLIRNLHNDLLEHELRIQRQTSARQSRVDSLQDSDNRLPSPTIPLSLHPRLAIPAPAQSSYSTPGSPSSPRRRPSIHSHIHNLPPTPPSPAYSLSAPPRTSLTPAEVSHKIANLKDAFFTPNPNPEILVPVTRYGGVGLKRGVQVPGLVVYLWKGRDYGVKKARRVVQCGKI